MKRSIVVYPFWQNQENKTFEVELPVGTEIIEAKIYRPRDADATQIYEQPHFIALADIEQPLEKRYFVALDALEPDNSTEEEHLRYTGRFQWGKSNDPAQPNVYLFEVINS